MEIYSTHTDVQLASLLRKGDKGAYKEIYDRYYQLMYVHAYKKLRDEEEAKDVVQELFSTLWIKRDHEVPTNFSAYLYTAVRNRILDLFAHQEVVSRHLNSLRDFIEKGVEATDHLVREKELTAYIEKEIQALPAKMREVFELSRKENLTHKEIAEKLQIKEQTVSKQITNALRILKDRLGIVLYLYFLIQ